MTRWKAAGSAPRNVEDKLWKRFRAAQDVFFTARDEANAALDKEYEENAVVKEAILVDAEKLLPIKDLEAARRAWLDIADRWEAAGKVPRGRVKEMEGRLRKVEQAVREASDQAWNRTDPEKSARADDMIGKLQKAIDDTRADLAEGRGGRRHQEGQGAQGGPRLPRELPRDGREGPGRLLLTIAYCVRR